jgi:hypothetical protein
VVQGTAWQRAVDAVDADGKYSKDAALKLFAIAFGGMPGVELPATPSGAVRSGTIALRAVLAHLGELTDAQRARIDEIRAVPGDSAGVPIVLSLSGAGHANAPAIPPVSDGERNLIKAKALQLRQDIKARVGTDIPGDMSIVFDPRERLDPVTGKPNAVGLAVTNFRAGKYTGCVIHLYPATFKNGANVVTTLAHEMIHCFQGAIAADEYWYTAASQWAYEGSAEWGSATLVGPDPLEDQMWPRYLTKPAKPLFQQTYEIGFFAHLQETGHSPWAAFRAMWAAKGNEAQYAAAGATNADFLDSWGSSMTRKAAFGAAWDTTGPGITADTAPTSALAVGKGATKVAAPPYTEKIYALEASTDLVDVRITGHARLGDGSVDETSLGSHTFCLRSDQCKCPDGTSPENATDLARSGAILALTGGPDGASGTVQGRDLDCKKGKGATWLLDSPSSYSGGPSHALIQAYTCTSLRGPWKATLHATHTPATSGDPPLDTIVHFSWTFDRNGRAVPTVGPYQDTVYHNAHTIIYYPVLHLDEAAGTITVVSIEGSEDGSPRIDVTHQLGRVGEPVPVKTGKSPKC